ncbi:HupE/UreJ family protein [Paenibacillus sp. HN-1]|uniref:HupE/UreJ family protein n=1 Tax=Paenibacillus TaxID=44249 RepID=UPI001CA8FE49|nr:MULTISPECIES: HupE/UreJ family protein [Paenibacillus]MBY9079032.1 HupE/UreJ family protein [Paenibacillus sp. CGMCC 1.18879]MBY9087590.1 HupE/UreJ family protein [Paenibacillus sinensis]
MTRLNVWVRCCLSFIFAAALLSAAGNTAEAHAYSAGYTTLDLTQSTTKMTYSLDQLSVMELTGGDTDKDGSLSAEEFAKVRDKLLSMLRENLTLQSGGQDFAWSQVESLELVHQAGGLKMVLHADYPALPSSAAVSLTDRLYMNSSGSNYVNLLTVHEGGTTLTEALSGPHRTWNLEADADRGAGDGSDGANGSNGSSSSGEVLQGWVSFFKLGMTHILTGYDHLLFLFSLLIAKQRFSQYAAMITAFTVAHSITLTLTVLGIINMPSSIVEPAIALSICFVAVENMVRKEVSRRWVLTFVFGLIHGMGFADILKEMNLPKSQLAVSLISFNLGIEAVQVALLAVLLPLLVLLHRWRFSRGAVLACSGLALLLGGVWLMQRLFFV